MHSSIWTWHGDPDDLAAKWLSLVAAAPPENMRFSACVRTADGIIVFDTCPTKQDFDWFSSSDAFQQMLAQHGLGKPTSLVDNPVVAAYALGKRIDND